MKISILGPCWPYRGGIAAFNERLAHQLQAEGHQVSLYTFTLQYPGFLFPGKTQFSEESAPSDLLIERKLSSVNPFTWLSLGRKINSECPDLLIIAYWLPFMAPALGSVARLAKKNGKTKVIGLLHNLIPHEHRIGDKQFSRYFIQSIDAALSLSKSVLDEISLFNTQLPKVFSPHPLYDNFGEPADREEACKKLRLDPSVRYLLFFGLIRSYKGLDWLIEACSKSEAILSGRYKLLVAGEFYGNESVYHELENRLSLNNHIEWHSVFVPDSEVRYYFSVADLIVQPYKTASQSGVTQIAYHFQKPMLVTRVGGLPEIVPDGKVGYVVDPDPSAIASGIDRFDKETPDFTEGLLSQKQKYSWSVMTSNLQTLYKNLQK